MSLKKWIILSVSLISGILLFSILPLFATNDTVSDLTLKANKTSWKTNENIELQVQDTNNADTKVVIPLPKGVTFLTVSDGNVSATMDKANQQVVLDWKENQKCNATIQLQVREAGEYTFKAYTIRNDQTASSKPLLLHLLTLKISHLTQTIQMLN
ncbi:hypothetical protein [Listeria aquatica]|uniref:hypothetical protein n=1 Tax=Listeria aquatica TaxID=1494960 RepID=UPI0031F4BF56